MQNYIIEFTKQIKVEGKNEGDAMQKAIDKLEQLLVKNQIQGTFDIYPEEY